MTDPVFDEAFVYTLANEGQKYTNDKDDRGGPTHYGLTLATFRQAFGPTADPERLRQMSIEEAKEVYWRLFWQPMRLEGLGSTRLQVALFDIGVLCGIDAAIKFLQGALKVQEDGKLGPITLGQANRLTTQELVFVYAQRVSAYFLMLARRDPTQQKWLYGWLCRAARLLTLAV